MVEQIIMRSGTQSSGNLDFESIVPSTGDSFYEQVRSCIDQLSAFIYPEGEPRLFITQQTFFIAAKSRKEYDERSMQIREQLSVNCGAMLPATSIVAQSPMAGSEVVLELICTRASSGTRVLYKKASGLSYTVVEQNGFRAVHATGMMGEPGDDIEVSADKAFRQAIDILATEGLDIQHVIRQWNYVESIARVEDPVHARQNYQVFNDIRTKYYNRGAFRYGYPAATGIGMTTGGVILGLIALSDSGDTRIQPIRNPRQVDAHRYSEEVLMGRDTGILERKCTPKFERGKVVSVGSQHHVYVSGTASIVGEETMHPGDVKAQTVTTIENIYGLFSPENQAALGLRFDVSRIRFSHLRVYVKYMKDFPDVKKICGERLRCASSLYLESDICREDLLVEIEGIFTLTDD